MTPQVQKVIDRLEAMDKQGESYDDMLHHGWRNPVRSDTGWLLYTYVLTKKPALILEIGTAYGLSGCYLAAALNGNGKMDTIEFHEGVAVEAQRNFDEAGLPVTVHFGDADEVIRRLAQKRNGFAAPRYSLVFLDADKKSYLRHLKMLIDLGLLMPDCVVLADNVIDRQAECQDFLAFMKQYPHWILATECGLLVGRLP